MGAGWIIMIVAVLVVVIQSDQASALTREEMDQLDDSIAQVKKNILSWDDKIEEQKKIISQKDKHIDELKEILRGIKSKLNDSWTAYVDVDNAEKNLEKGIAELSTEKEHLTKLINERSVFYRFIRENISFLDEEPIEKIQSKIKLLGIQISKSCLMLSNCLSYNDIIHFDSSDQNISGKFINVNGKTERDVSPYKQSWRIYDTDDTTRIIVDPPQGMADKISMITIYNNFGIYFKPGDFTINNHTRTWSEGRYVENCSSAFINSDLNLLNDTIVYMQSGCETTSYNEDKQEIIIPSSIDITTSPNWQAQEKLKQDLIKCKGLCFEY